MSTHFERLGLPRRFALNETQLERQYLAGSRATHPDHTGNDPGSHLASAELNEAYNVLREPFRRADYLLELEGGPSASEVKQLPPEFLEEMLELRMTIEEVKAHPDPDSSERANLQIQLVQRREALLADVAEQFLRLEALPTGSGDRFAILTRIREQLNACRYLQGLLRDLRDS